MVEDPGDTDAFGELLPQAALDQPAGDSTPVTDFKPWHLPRKQHVRSTQWNAPIAGLIDELSERQTIRYLCLPGEDLLDIATVADLCEQKGRKLRYLGFDTDMQRQNISTQRLVSHQIIAQKPSIEPESSIVPDNFASIANLNSKGYLSLRDGGSYDVVNLDLCDSFTSSASNLHDALMRILTHQFNSRAQSWLLFLTTRSELGALPHGEQQAYFRLLSSNASSSAAFLLLIGEILGQSLSSAPEAELLTQHCHSNPSLSGQMLSLGIGKWLASIAREPDPWRVDMLSVWSYRTGMSSSRATEFAQQPANLFSIVFKFRKIQVGRIDTIGLANSTSGGIVPSEPQMAEKMAKCVRHNTKDVDTELAADPALAAKLQSECEDQLSVRNYSISHYREWLKPSLVQAG